MRYFFNMKIVSSKDGISISQWKYILDLMTETNMLGSKPSDTPIKVKKKTKINNRPNDKDRYQRLDGKLSYLSHTRSYIAFVVIVVSQHMH